MRTWSWIGSNLVFLLAAAKAHGRELRLERVAAGVERVVFGGDNPPFVEALWRAERVRFWVVAPVVGLVIGAALRARGLGLGAAVTGGASWAAALTLAGLGLASAWRGGFARGGHGGSLAWWTLVAAAGAGSTLLLLRRLALR